MTTETATIASLVFSTPHFDHIETFHNVEMDRFFDMYKCVETGKFHLVELIGSGDIVSVMPNDMPAGGGYWTASETNSGIAYVSRGYSEGYVRRVARELASEEI